MRSRSIRRAGAAIAASIAAGLLVAPAAANAAPAVAEGDGETPAAGCEVTGGTLSWGVKETFRAYISGSIVNGEWETSDGADYKTPNFTWDGATGSIDPETGTGAVSFTGTIHFTGHDGVLDLTLANPTIEFEGDGQAALLLDAKSNDMEGELAVDETQARSGEIAVGDDIAPEDGTLELADLETILTDDGAEAFAGFYEGGIELDPLTLNLEVGECAAAAGGGSSQEPAPALEPQILEAPAPEIPWLPLVIGGVALLVIGFTIGLLIGGRRPKTPASAVPVAPVPAPEPPVQETPAPDAHTQKLFGADR